MCCKLRPVLKKRWIKILIGALAGSAVLLLLVTGGVWLRARSAPAWYRPPTDPQAVDRSARQFEDRLVEVRNTAAAIAAAEARARRSANPQASTPQTGEFELRLPAGEATAFLLKWAKLEGWEARYSQWVEEPMVTVEGGCVVVGGKLAGVPGLGGGVAGVHLRPELSENGEAIRLTLDRVTVGGLTLPSALISGQLARARDPLARGVQRWSADARVDANGLTNFPTALALAGRVVLGTIDGKGAEPVLSLPVDDRRGVLVRVTAVRVEGRGEAGVVVVRGRPVAPGERSGVLARLKG